MNFALERAKNNIIRMSKLDNFWNLSIDEIDRMHKDMDFIAKNMEKPELLKFLDTIGK